MKNPTPLNLLSSGTDRCAAHHRQLGGVQTPSGNTSIDFPTNTDATTHSLHLRDRSVHCGWSSPRLVISPATIVTLPADHVQLPARPGGRRYAQEAQPLGPGEPGGISQAKIDTSLTVFNDLKHDDGGWGWWKEDESRVFMTAYVVCGLGQAKGTGYDKAGTISAADGLPPIRAGAHPR